MAIVIDLDATREQRRVAQQIRAEGLNLLHSPGDSILADCIVCNPITGAEVIWDATLNRFVDVLKEDEKPKC